VTRSADAQVEECIRAYVLDWQVDGAVRDVLRKALCELLAGKFAEEPLPAIIPPPWPHAAPPHVFKQLGERYCVAVGGLCPPDGWSSFYGPVKPTPLLAIEAWNSAFSRKDER
jgi:hypothetical protein